MVKIMLLVLAMASGLMAEKCREFGDVDIQPQAYKLVVRNDSYRPAPVYVRTADVTQDVTVAPHSSLKVTGYELGGWRVLVRKSVSLEKIGRLKGDLAAKLKQVEEAGIPYRGYLDPSTVSDELAEIASTIRVIEDVGSGDEDDECTGFTWNVLDGHVIGNVLITITFAGVNWHLHCGEPGP